MRQRLSDSVVRALSAPETGNRIYYDDDHKARGFGVRVTAAGARAFVFNYRTKAGRERRYTIGQFPAWKTTAARGEAVRLRVRVDSGDDPQGETKAARDAPRMADLWERFRDEHLVKLREGTRRDYSALARNHILPAMKSLPVENVQYEDVDGLHRKITKAGAPYVANRTVALLSKMFALSIRWRWRADNPAKGIERNQEEKRQRYLDAAEIRKLSEALGALEDQQGANIIRTLMLTGSRRGEVLAMRWDGIDLEGGTWTKPAATTKQKKDHRVPLSGPARQLLGELKDAADEGAEYVFPGRSGGHRAEVKRTWRDACLIAGLTVEAKARRGGREVKILKPNARLHDLRHTYASVLAGAGLSLPLIGALLGHTQPATTARYAHLSDDPQRRAAERAAAIITGGSDGEVVSMERGR
ncbi:MAG: tyrosine-type recombinase/integrase [Oceanicaulis sp.]